MPKMKIRKSIFERVRITSTGKVLRRKMGLRHLRSSKQKKQIRGYKKLTPMGKTMARKVKKMLGK